MFSVIPEIINKTGYLYVFVEMHRLIVDVVLHKEVVNAGQEGHLRQGEYVHELFHGVAMRALQDREATLYSIVCIYVLSLFSYVKEEMIITLP